MQRPTIGVLLGLGAGLLWGTVFVAPQLLPTFGPVEIALGRYSLYGLFSAGLLAASGPRRSGGESSLAVARKAWPLALAFAFAGHVGMYVLLVVGIRLAGAPVATALIGTVPVTVAVAGNLVEREFPWRRLALPLTLILPGLTAINLAGTGPGAPTGGGGRLVGLLCILGTVGLWTFYGGCQRPLLEGQPFRLGAGVVDDGGRRHPGASCTGRAARRATRSRGGGVSAVGRASAPIMTRHLIHRPYKRALRRAKLPDYHGFGDLRHTFATLMFDHDVHPKVVREMMGHSSVKVTMDIYSQWSPGLHAGISDSLGDVFG